jgi:DNA-binding NtrC family response regulator
LLVDPDEAFVQALQQVLDSGYGIRCAAQYDAATRILQTETLDAILLNLDTHGNHGIAVEARRFLLAAAERKLAPPVIAYGWDDRKERALEAFQLGALDYLEQPLDVQELRIALDGACRRHFLACELAAAQSVLPAVHVPGLLGNSRAMEEVSDVIRKVAGVSTTVLITGESGTGKGVVARAIHTLGGRAAKPFVAFAGCSFPESLVEDELFGHERGAFTGANGSRRGRFEEATGGTIFLDEIGDLALPLQAKLLRVLQERSLERLGSNASHPIDVRVICATNRNLEKMVAEGTFREDLYFRISVVKIHVPPLRERGEDIPLLAEYFLRTFAKAHGKPAHFLTPGFLGALARHNWPGNVRELQNLIERSLVLTNGNTHLGVEDLPPELRGDTTKNETVAAGSFHEAIQGFKRELVRSALRMHSGNRMRAARELRISRCYLHRLLNQLQIVDEAPADEEAKPTPVGRRAEVARHAYRRGAIAV